MGAHVLERIFLGQQVGAERGQVVDVQISRREPRGFEQQLQRLVLVLPVKGARACRNRWLAE